METEIYTDSSITICGVTVVSSGPEGEELGYLVYSSCLGKWFFKSEPGCLFGTVPLLQINNALTTLNSI